MTNTQALFSRGSWRLAAAGVAGVSWIATLLWIGQHIGLRGIGAGLLLSIPITLALVLAFRWLNRTNNPQPVGMLVAAFLWGATVTAIAGIGAQAVLQVIAEASFGVEAGAWIRPLIIAPLTEDTLKGVFLVWLFLVHRQRITGVLDGIVIGGLVGVGFTFTENILYFGQMVLDLIAGGFTSEAYLGFAGIFFLRGGLLPFFHALMGMLIGIGVGLAVRRRSPGAQAGTILAGFGAAWLLHGIWDWAAIANANPEPYVATVYLSLLVPSFLAVAVTAVILRRRAVKAMVSAGASTRADRAIITGAIDR
ncbi:PrsW family intramembrane metalloprotease [Pseudoclavibacter helvolus]|uniref:PrsW family intramembrane metalloprotease n=1 Tax=Pseudoclavibacter helvolus TaxID=255205 RepID=UPI003C73A6EC